MVTAGSDAGRHYCSDCEKGVQVQPFEGQTECFRCFSGADIGYSGVDCSRADGIWVNEGFYRPEEANLHPNVSVISSSDAMAVACPWAGACLGGKMHGNLSCEEGHYGILCQSCVVPKYYRADDECRLCPQEESRSRAEAVTALLVLACIAVIVVMALYLRTASVSAGGSNYIPLAWLCPRAAGAIAVIPPTTHRQLSAIIKIGLGLVQCLSTLRRFSRVRWPTVFEDFMSVIDQFTIEVNARACRPL